MRLARVVAPGQVLLPAPGQRVAKSVLRTAPCLLGLFSLICLIFAKHAKHHRIRVRATAWYVKTEPTLSNAIAAVRRLFGADNDFCKGVP